MCCVSIVTLRDRRCCDRAHTPLALCQSAAAQVADAEFGDENAASLRGTETRA